MLEKWRLKSDLCLTPPSSAFSEIYSDSRIFQKIGNLHFLVKLHPNFNLTMLQDSTLKQWQFHVQKSASDVILPEI